MPWKNKTSESLKSDCRKWSCRSLLRIYVSANPGIKGEFESLLWRAKRGLAVSQNLRQQSCICLSNYVFYFNKSKMQKFRDISYLFEKQGLHVQVRTGQSNLMHLYPTSINVLLLPILLSDVQVVALHQ